MRLGNGVLISLFLWCRCSSSPFGDPNEATTSCFTNSSGLAENLLTRKMQQTCMLPESCLNHSKTRQWAGAAAASTCELGVYGVL